jgi:FkbM family methyltransferase
LHIESLLRFGSLLLRFRNGWTLVQAMRSGQPCGELVLWDGTRIVHPPGRGGLVEIVSEIWIEQVYTRGFYRPADGDVIVDAGANIGLFAIMMARANRNCRIVALEPFRENFEFLQANVARACPGNVVCQRTALGAASGRGSMKAVGSRSLDHRLEADSGGQDGVPVVPLSALFELAQRSEVDFLKVDIEGAEHAVFAGVTPELAGRFRHIALEYHDQIVPGTLALLQQVLGPTHELAVHPAAVEGVGILRARRKEKHHRAAARNRAD